MTDEQKIKNIIDLFLDGKTTIEQEQWLFEQFSRPDLDPSLEPMRRMMGWFASGLTEPVASPVATRQTEAEAKPARSRPHRFSLIRIASIAAMIAVIISIGVFLSTHNDSSPAVYGDSDGVYTVCYLIRDGVKYTDPEVVLPEIAMIQSRIDQNIPEAPADLPLPEQLFLDHLRNTDPTGITYKTFTNQINQSE